MKGRQGMEGGEGKGLPSYLEGKLSQLVVRNCRHTGGGHGKGEGEVARMAPEHLAAARAAGHGVLGGGRAGLRTVRIARGGGGKSVSTVCGGGGGRRRPLDRACCNGACCNCA